MKHQRRRLFVDPGFQGRLLVRLGAYWAIYHVFLWHLLFLFSLFSKLISQGSTGPAKSLFSHYCEFAFDHMTIPICFLVTLPVIGRDLLKFSHRLVGPLIRFREVMKEMVHGKPVSEVTLRPHDLPTDFLAVFNELVKTWNERLADPAHPNPSDNQLELVESAGTQ